MADLKKLTGITGLDTAHPLYSSISSFLNFDTVITDIKSGATYTSTAAVVDDIELGISREFDANADVVTPNISVPFSSTVVLVYKPIGLNTGGATSVALYLNLNSGGNAFVVESANYTGYDYRVQYRGSVGSYFTATYVPYKTNGSTGVITDQTTILNRKNIGHATAFDFKSGASTALWQNGVSVPLYAQTVAPSFTPSVNPVSVPVGAATAAAAGYRMSAIIVFNRVLTDLEKAEVTAAPWELVLGELPLEVSLSSVLTPNATITATLTNYETLPTTITITDGLNNDLVLPFTATGANTGTFTVPSLASTGTGLPYLHFGSIDLTFGAKTITSTFNPVSPLEYITLVSPVETYIFQDWDMLPVAGEQLTSEGNFDVNGNFTGADPEGTYDCWITRLDGTNEYFTVTLGETSFPFEANVTPSSVTITPKTLQLSTGVSFSGNVTSTSLSVTLKSLSLSTGIGFVQNVLPYSVTITPQPLQFVSFRNIPIDAKRIFFIK